MPDTTRRRMVAAGAAMAGAAATGLVAGVARARNGFMAASAGPGEADRRRSAEPGLQGITALCEVTGGGRKVYGVAIDMTSRSHRRAWIPRRTRSGWCRRRYERTTMNDYWEHTNDVENTQRLVESLLRGTWNHGNPNLDDRRDKVLRIDPAHVYCTGWSMGAMTSLWLMAKRPDVYAGGLIVAGQRQPADMVTLAHQNVLIITGSRDDEATSWNEKCVPVWREAGARVTRPTALLDPSLIFPIGGQKALAGQIDRQLAAGGDITFLTFDGVDHMESARKFFYIEAARNWLFRQTKPVRAS